MTKQGYRIYLCQEYYGEPIDIDDSDYWEDDNGNRFCGEWREIGHYSPEEAAQVYVDRKVCSFDIEPEDYKIIQVAVKEPTGKISVWDVTIHLNWTYRAKDAEIEPKIR